MCSNSFLSLAYCTVMRYVFVITDIHVHVIIERFIIYSFKKMLVGCICTRKYDFLDAPNFNSKS